MQDEHSGGPTMHGSVAECAEDCVFVARLLGYLPRKVCVRCSDDGFWRLMGESGSESCARGGKGTQRHAEARKGQQKPSKSPAGQGLPWSSAPLPVLYCGRPIQRRPPCLSIAAIISIFPIFPRCPLPFRNCLPPPFSWRGCPSALHSLPPCSCAACSLPVDPLSPGTW